MDWANERWVRLYTRDTTTWKMLDWRARTVLMHMLRKVDRAGVLEVGDTGTMGLAAVLELPLEIVEPGVERLLHPRLRVVVETPTAYVLPNYLEAQEAVQTTNHRSAEYRARKRDYALAAAKPAIAELVRLPAPARTGDDVTPRDGAVTKRDASITRGHATSPVLDLDTSDRGDLSIEIDQPITPIVTKRDADITPRDETITRHHAASQLVTPILSDPKDLSPSARAIPLSTESSAGTSGDAKAPQPEPADTRPTPADRTAVRERLRAELEAARGRAAHARGVMIKPLLAFDRGIDVDLSGQLNLQPTREALAVLEEQALHAIAMAEIQVTNGAESFQWFTGAIFAGGNFSRLAGTPEDDARRSRAGPRGSAARAPEPAPRRLKNLARP